MTYDAEVFDKLNPTKPNWETRYSIVKDMFPSITKLDWANIFKEDPHIMGNIINDLIKASEASPRRPGKRSSVSADTTRDNLLSLAGEDYSLEPFIETFRKVAYGKSVRAIAAKTGLDRNLVHRLQTGKVQPDIFAMESIATAYGKSADYFLEYRMYFITATIIDHLDYVPEAGVHFYRKLRKIGRHG
jgi:hypothetical protein